MIQKTLISHSVSDRVDLAINKAVDLFINKLSKKYYSISVEAPFQLHVMKCVEQILDQLTFSKNERFIVDLEKNIPLNGRNDEVDGVIEYYFNGDLKEQYLIEFKYKKPKDGGPNSINIEAYVDIAELEQQLNNPIIKGCYFIFLTNDKDFTVPGRNSTANRMVFPLHDGYTIEARRYSPLVPAAVKQLKCCGHPEGYLSFNKQHLVEYSHFNDIDNNQYWYLLMKI